MTLGDVSDADCAAARRQLAELELQYQHLQDNRPILQLSSELDSTAKALQDAAYARQEQQLWEQIISLSSIISAAEAQDGAMAGGAVARRDNPATPNMHGKCCLPCRWQHCILFAVQGLLAAMPFIWLSELQIQHPCRHRAYRSDI